MIDYQEYTIEANHHQGNGNGYHGNGYDKLDGYWALFYKVAKGFTHRVKPEDRQDFLHDLMLIMARVKAKYEIIGKPLTEAGLVRIACYEVVGYWRKNFRQIKGIECGLCSNRQRNKCKEREYRECPRAIKIESLEKLIEDGEGNQVELYQMVADDSAIDVVAMLDARFTLNSYPRQAVLIAYKKYTGCRLDNKEQVYLNRFRKRLQKTFVLV
ncbi:MAG: hypothetical protein HY665_02030 [Chloroflexi bacterium]|nr:hypothetical protein [Chloroflexota bacterium]